MVHLLTKLRLPATTSPLLSTNVIATDTSATLNPAKDPRGKWPSGTPGNGEMDSLSSKKSPVCPVYVVSLSFDMNVIVLWETVKLPLSALLGPPISNVYAIVYFGPEKLRKN